MSVRSPRSPHWPRRGPPTPVRGARAPAGTIAREHLAGLALALYLVSGSWSLARVAGVEPMAIWQPRVWAVLALVALACLPRSRYAPRVSRGSGSALLPELAWLGLTLLAITWAPAIELATNQAIDLLLLIGVALSLRRLAASADIEGLAKALRLGLTAVLALLALLALIGGVGGGRMAVLGGGPNVFGRNMGILCLLALERTLSQTHPGAGRTPGGSLGWIVLACLAAGLVTLSGSRGAMFSTAMAGAWLLALGPAKLQRRLAICVLVSGSFIAVLLFTSFGNHIMDSFAARVIDLLFGDHYVSSRDRIYVIALEGGARSPVLGRGLASFAAATPWPYAHNIVLDAWYETGLLGVAALGLYCGRVSVLLARVGTAGRELWVAIAVLIAVGAQFSGGRYDARALLVCVAIALLLPPPNPGLRP